MRIGLFDSGVGGLTVLRSLIDRYPNNEYIYYGDTLNIPYGSKSICELKELACKNIDILLEKGADIIVVACGTVSSNCMDYLRDKYMNIEIYDVISNTLKYLNNSSFKNILIIGTERTISSHIFRDNINSNVCEVATPKLVPLIENNDFDKIDNIISKYLSDYRDIDSIVLGCTHYPIITRNINMYYRGKVKIINMGEIMSISNRCCDGNSDRDSGVRLYFSKIDKGVISNCNNILMGIDFLINK